ncbi:MAG TPA: hypothetical protein DDW50_01580 [Firmicutes bacterium]|jgi:hypothetical protein|nr:hypothetical protein [Bacillota bacterium]
MKQKYPSIIIVLIIICLNSFTTFSMNNQSTHAVWYEYEPKEVLLSGRLELAKAYGPPNYGADPAHDQKVSYYVLKLDSPINVKGNPADELNSETVTNVRELQIVYDQLDQISKWKNQKVTIKGTLFKGFNARHYTDVLITVKEIRLNL